MTESLSNSICRSCLEPTTFKKYPLTGKVVNVEVDVVSMLEFCTSSQMDLSDDLPNSVCLSCFKTIRIAYRFLKQFYEAQTKLIECRNILKKENNEIELECNSSENENSTVQDFLSIHNYAEQSTHENEVNEEDEKQEEMEELEILERSEDESFNLVEIKEEFCEDVPNFKEENPDLVQLLNLGDTDIEHTNIEVVVDNDSKTDGGEKVYRYICPICDQKFWKVETFYSHVTSYNLSTIKCTRCSLHPELDMDEYFQHYMDYHKFHCDVCGKVMSSSYGYHYHMKHHDNIRNFKCPVEGCNRSFLMNHLLKKHVRSHTEKSTYACQFCEATFNTNDSLRYHLKLHYGKKDHLCTVCGQAFYQAVHLRDHMYRHIGYKKFVCDICGKGFITNGSLKKHIQYCSRKHNLISSDNIEIMQI